MRISEGVVEAPIYTLRNPRTASQISVITLNHHGSPAYYDQIAAVAYETQDRGGLVYYESFGREPAAGVDPKLEALTRRLLETRAMGAAASRIMGLTPQREYLQWGAGWRNADMAAHEVAESLGPRLVEKHYRKTKRTVQAMKIFVRNQATKEDPKVTALKLRRLYNTLSIADDYRLSRPSMWRPGLRRFRDVMDQRTDKQLDALGNALKINPGLSFALLWSEGHIPDLYAGIRQYGYAATDKRWLDVFSLREY